MEKNWNKTLCVSFTYILVLCQWMIFVSFFSFFFPSQLIRIRLIISHFLCHQKFSQVLLKVFFKRKSILVLFDIPWLVVSKLLIVFIFKWFKFVLWFPTCMHTMNVPHVYACAWKVFDELQGLFIVHIELSVHTHNDFSLAF